MYNRLLPPLPSFFIHRAGGCVATDRSTHGSRSRDLQAGSSRWGTCFKSELPRDVPAGLQGVRQAPMILERVDHTQHHFLFFSPREAAATRIHRKCASQGQRRQERRLIDDSAMYGDIQQDAPFPRQSKGGVVIAPTQQNNSTEKTSNKKVRYERGGARLLFVWSSPPFAAKKSTCRQVHPTLDTCAE